MRKVNASLFYHKLGYRVENYMLKFTFTTVEAACAIKCSTLFFSSFFLRSMLGEPTINSMLGFPNIVAFAMWSSIYRPIRTK